jgi:hypothetical protein
LAIEIAKREPKKSDNTKKNPLFLMVSGFFDMELEMGFEPVIEV